MPAIDPEVQRTYESIRAGDLTWAVFADDGYRQYIVDHVSVDSDYDAFCGRLAPDDAKVRFAYRRFEAGENGSERAKYALFVWAPGHMTMKFPAKSRLSTDKLAIQQVVQDWDAEVVASQRDDLAHAKVVAQLGN
ncbi:hypothetical protein [Streptomyces sp. NPDC058632]|uniref:hypothetical protein n=1 Tax=unclassified Streptomyces TaxID=2593676 RepID=UPI0036549238